MNYGTFSMKLIKKITDLEKVKELKDLQEFKALIKSEFTSAGVVDINKILDEGTPVAVWNARQGKKTTIKLFALFISDLVNTFNVSRQMSGPQIMELAEDLATDLWFVKFEEIPAFFEAIKKGTIGKVYERLDAPLIWEFWDIYARKRSEVIESRQAAKMFADPGNEKTIEDRREGKIESFGDAIRQVKNTLREI